MVKQLTLAEEYRYRAIAENGARLINEHAAERPETEWWFEYPPESFTGTELDFAAEICNAVIDIWRPDQRSARDRQPAVHGGDEHIYAEDLRLGDYQSGVKGTVTSHWGLTSY